MGSDRGTVGGLAMPVAAEARRQAAERRHLLEITLCLPPCQYASGEEQGAAISSGLFDQVIGPAATLRLSVGLPGWAPAGTPIVLHVGGDVWYSRPLARPWGAGAGSRPPGRAGGAGEPLPSSRARNKWPGRTGHLNGSLCPTASSRTAWPGAGCRPGRRWLPALPYSIARGAR